jgi:hypothetical protein
MGQALGLLEGIVTWMRAPPPPEPQRAVAAIDLRRSTGAGTTRRQAGAALGKCGRNVVFSVPQSGQRQLAGIAAKGVPGAIDCCGKP